MIVVESMFFDSDDYQVDSEVIPCDSKETAKAVVKKVYDKLIEDYDFNYDDDPKAAQKKWEDRYVRKQEDGSIKIQGGDCGYGWIKIVEKEPVTAGTLSGFDPKVGNIY